MSNIKETPISKTVSMEFKNVILLFFAFSFSFGVSRFFFKPYEQYGILNIYKINPEDNYLFIFSLLVCTISLFFGLKKLSTKSPLIFRTTFISLLLFSFLIGVVAPSVSKYENNVDTFHNGEQLAPAVAFNEGKKPYKDLFVLRGAGEDIITPSVSLKIFGESIGSYYFLSGLLQLLTAAIFLILISYIFKRDFEFLFVSLWFLSSVYGSFYSTRDIFVWLSIGLVFSIFSTTSWQREKLATLGLLASLSLFYSFDRGIFLSSLLAITTLCLVIFDRDGKYFQLKYKDFHKRTKVLLVALCGYIGGITLVILVLGPDVFLSFIKTTFGEAAKYQGAIFNSPYPHFNNNSFVEWLPIIVLLCLSLVIIQTIKIEGKNITPATIFEIILLVFGFIFFRGATGRPDIGHIAYGSTVIFLLLFIVVFRRLNLLLMSDKQRLAKISMASLPLILVFVATLSSSIVNYYKISAMVQTPLSSTKTFITSSKKPDTFWETVKVEEITKYINDSTDENDSFFVFSSDPIFYYTTKLHNPTRYSISWFADPNPLEEQMLNELKSDPPKIILYKSGTYYDRPDYISMSDRLPKVNSWVLSNYEEKVDLGDGAIILQKKNKY